MDKQFMIKTFGVGVSKKCFHFANKIHKDKDSKIFITKN